MKRLTRKPMNFVEDDLQECLVRFFRLCIKPEVAHIWAIPNGGSRKIQEAVRLKLAGVTKGVPDLIIVQPLGKVFWVEVKRPANPLMKQAAGKLSDEQKEIHKWLNENGHTVYTVSSIHEFQAILKNENLIKT